VVLPVEQGHLDVHKRVASEDAVLHRLLAAGIHRRDVLPRDATAGHLVLELVTAVDVAATGLDRDDHAGVLA